MAGLTTLILGSLAILLMAELHVEGYFGWGSWGGFNACTKPCLEGTGYTYRYRECNSWYGCAGSYWEGTPCNKTHCPMCEDQLNNCAQNKHACEMNADPRTNCAQTCGYCIENDCIKSDDTCVDLPGKKTCQQYKNFCQSGNKMEREKMYDLCPVTCGQCNPKTAECPATFKKFKCQCTQNALAIMNLGKETTKAHMTNNQICRFDSLYVACIKSITTICPNQQWYKDLGDANVRQYITAYDNESIQKYGDRKACWNDLAHQKANNLWWYYYWTVVGAYLDLVLDD